MPGPKKNDPNRQRKEDTLLKERVNIPRRYKVLMHNDDYTPMEFVTHVLEDIFHKSPAEASRIMLQVHKSGIGVAGVYSREVAETKAALTMDIARSVNYPLLLTTEPE